MATAGELPHTPAPPVDGRLAWLSLLLLLVTRPVGAVPATALAPDRRWTLHAVRFEGNHALWDYELRRVLVIEPRAWFAFWRASPEFHVPALAGEVESVRALYRRRGYYRAVVSGEVEVPEGGDGVTVVFHIDEGDLVRVGRLDLTLGGVAQPEAMRTTLLARLPLAPDRPFTQEAYDEGVALLVEDHRRRGFARVSVEKRAIVDPARGIADVSYRVESGPRCVFGEIAVTGTRTVEPEVVRREVSFHAGQPFDARRLEQSQRKLMATRLFRSVRLVERVGEGATVDVDVAVVEAPPREIRLGLGYDTDEQLWGLFAWRRYNFLGDGRELGVSARASVLRRDITADFIQPHFPTSNDRLRLSVSQTDDEQDTYTLVRSRLSPRLDWYASESWIGFVFYRAEYDVLTDVSEPVRQAVPDAAPANGVLSGGGVGLTWSTLDDPFEPTRGWMVTGAVEPVGGPLGGDFTFLRVTTEVRALHRLVGALSAAGRARLGTELEPSDDHVPLFERFYAGGLGSVRGYGYRRIGPLVDDTPIGGRSLLELSLELRHPVTDHLSAAVFCDGGQLGQGAWDFDPGGLQRGVGIGASYASRVGPLRVDVGFPIDAAPKDQRWQIYLSIGRTF